MYDKLKDMDAKEIHLPETAYVRDIETKVFQGIALQCLAKIEGICLPENTLFDNLLGRDVERIKGIHVEQDHKKHSVNIRVEINVRYGLSLPEKAEEIQSKIVEEVSHLTGLHVASVHVIFKNLILPEKEALISAKKEEIEEDSEMLVIEEEFHPGPN